MAKRTVLLDRDGTINADKHYLSDPDDLELLPGVVEGLRRLTGLGLGLVIVTNQSGVARGYFDEARVEEINARLIAMLAAEGVAVDGVYYCPHAPDEDCDCRKPLPGMGLRAAEELGFDPGESFMIGDKPADIGLGEALGAETFLVRTGYGAETEAKGKASPDHVVDTVAEAAAIIARRLEE